MLLHSLGNYGLHKYACLAWNFNIGNHTCPGDLPSELCTYYLQHGSALSFLNVTMVAGSKGQSWCYYTVENQEGTSRYLCIHVITLPSDVSKILEIPYFLIWSTLYILQGCIHYNCHDEDYRGQGQCECGLASELYCAGRR